MTRRRRTSSHVHGLLIIDKDAGLTSHDVVARARKITGISRIGHTGTLDPIATGVLVLCLGKATRLSEYLQGHDKRYVATIRLGVSTNTYDAQGEVIQERPVPVLTIEQLRSILSRFAGPIGQRPPTFSAIKVQGTPAYRLARRGEVVQLPERQVIIHRLTLIDWSPPDLTIEVHCSAGTYIRSLAHDIGEAIGCGGHVRALRRTASGPFTIEQAITLETLAELAAQGRWQHQVLPIAAAVQDLRQVLVSEQETAALRHGQPITADHAAQPDAIAAALTPDGQLVAIVRYDADRNQWRPSKVLI
ncbi:MAG: tRNA pseudouridine(55) synthase TruB [Anaerolineae bacterium]